MGSRDEPIAEGRRGDVADRDHSAGPVVSYGALRLHAQALLASFESGHAGFVPDDHLHPDRVRPGHPGHGEIAEWVDELCAAGLWTRVDGGGYRVVSSEALRMAGEVHRQMRAQER